MIIIIRQISIFHQDKKNDKDLIKLLIICLNVLFTKEKETEGQEISLCQ